MSNAQTLILACVLLTFNPFLELQLTFLSFIGLKSLWSQIGGFIGIFFGYGLMQVSTLHHRIELVV